MKPIILVTCPVADDGQISLMKDYTDALSVAGALPLILPYTTDEGVLTEYAEMADGYLFTGGVDVEPARYGEEKHGMCGEIQLLRDDIEFRLYKMIGKTGKPIMAICRGMQVINVAEGGTLWQDLPSECPSDILHRQTVNKYLPWHRVNVVEGTPLEELAGGTVAEVNSFHHQAVKTVGEGLEVMARASDGVIEALYGTEYPYIRLYQWHPERLYKTDECNRKIFFDFVDNVKRIKEVGK